MTDQPKEILDERCTCEHPRRVHYSRKPLSGQHDGHCMHCECPDFTRKRFLHAWRHEIE